MKLKYFLVLAAALPLAGLDSLPDTAWAAPHSHSPSRNYSHPNFQGFRSGNIYRHNLNNNHIRPYKLNKSYTSPHPYNHINNFSHVNKFPGVNKYGYIHRQINNPNFKNLSSTQFKKAVFSKPNIWSNKLWGGKGRHNVRWSRWYGPVFWPYFFGDYFCYGFWPDDCSGVYWGYGPDVILWGAFWPAGEYGYDETAAYDAADSGDIFAPYRAPARIAHKQPEASNAAETCSGFAPGVSDLPIQKLESIIDATEEQRTALADLKAAVAQASDILQKSCPSETPLTPVDRLNAMRHRLEAMEEANGAVKGPFVRLYGLLSDEQKQRLEAASKPSSKPQLARAKDVNVADLCSSQAGFSSVPADQIASTITLTSAQELELEKVKAATAKASDELKNSCPSSIPETLEGRLDAAKQRLAALIAAVDMVQPAVAGFYASLTDEQKAALSVQPAPQNRG